MYFTTLTEISNILFFGWNTDSWADVFIGFIIICILTIFFEALKAAKSSLVFYNRRPLTSPDQRTHHEEEHEATSSQADLLSSLRIPVGSQHSQIRKFFLFLVESGLHMFNFLYGYILMLLVMTFSIWFLLAILLGSGVGFFICHPFGQDFIARYSSKRRTPRSCHGGAVVHNAGPLIIS
ncbi:hypothetical protein BsWGS_23489 [Bradybaena similaris]